MEEYVLNWKCCLCSFLDRPRENTKNVIQYNRSPSRHSNRSPVEYKSEALPSEQACSFTWCHFQLIPLTPSARPYLSFSFTWWRKLYCKTFKIFRSSLRKFFQRPVVSSVLSTSILRKTFFSDTLNLIFFLGWDTSVTDLKNKIKLCFLHFDSFKF